MKGIVSTVSLSLAFFALAGAWPAAAQNSPDPGLQAAEELQKAIERFKGILEAVQKGEAVRREDLEWAKTQVATELARYEVPNALEEMRNRIIQAVDAGIRAGEIKPEDRTKVFRELMKQALEMRSQVLQNLRAMQALLGQAKVK